MDPRSTASPPTGLPQPPPVWGPDPATQLETGITATSAFIDLLNANIDTDPQSPLIPLSRVAAPQDWAPALLAALHERLRLADLLDPMVAWATFNIVLGRAVLTCNLPLVRACLAEHRWRPCIKSNGGHFVTKTTRTCRKILPLLAADARFGQDFLWPIVKRTVRADEFGPYRHSASLVATILATPCVDPWIVWQEALEMSVDSMVKVRRIWRVGESPLFDPEWAWRRCVAATTAGRDWQVDDDVSPRLDRQPRWPAGGPPCAKLLIDLPTDIQYMLHQLLDAQSVGRIRSACRALSLFPMARFACRRLHFECYLSATRPEYQFNPDRFQSVLANALSTCSHSQTQRNELIGRVLVEAARHVTNLEHAFDLLTQLDTATHPTTASFYLTWTLHTLLTSTRSPTLATSTLLHHVLVHSHLPLEAWSLVAGHHDAATAILANEPQPPLFPVDPHQECIKRVFLHLLRTRAFPSSNWSLSATMFPDLFANQSARMRSWRPARATRLLLALVTLSNSPATLDLVLDVPLDQDELRVIKSLIRSYALKSPACPPAFVAQVLRRTQLGISIMPSELADLAPSSQYLAPQECTRRAAVVDVLFEYLGSAEIIRIVVLSILCRSDAVKWVVWRGMWWWLKLASKADKGWAKMRSWIGNELDEVRRGEVVVEVHAVVWLTELQELWEQKQGWNMCVVQ